MRSVSTATATRSDVSAATLEREGVSRYHRHQIQTPSGSMLLPKFPVAKRVASISPSTNSQQSSSPLRYQHEPYLLGSEGQDLPAEKISNCLRSLWSFSEGPKIVRIGGRGQGGQGTAAPGEQLLTPSAVLSSSPTPIRAGTSPLPPSPVPVTFQIAPAEVVAGKPQHSTQNLVQSEAMQEALRIEVSAERSASRSASQQPPELAAITQLLLDHHQQLEEGQRGGADVANSLSSSDDGMAEVIVTVIESSPESSASPVRQTVQPRRGGGIPPSEVPAVAVLDRRDRSTSPGLPEVRAVSPEPTVQRELFTLPEVSVSPPAEMAAPVVETANRGIQCEERRPEAAQRGSQTTALPDYAALLAKQQADGERQKQRLLAESRLEGQQRTWWYIANLSYQLFTQRIEEIYRLSVDTAENLNEKEWTSQEEMRRAVEKEGRRREQETANMMEAQYQTTLARDRGYFESVVSMAHVEQLETMETYEREALQFRSAKERQSILSLQWASDWAHLVGEESSHRIGIIETESTLRLSFLQESNEGRVTFLKWKTREQDEFWGERAQRQRITYEEKRERFEHYRRYTVLHLIQQRRMRAEDIEASASVGRLAIEAAESESRRLVTRYWKESTTLRLASHALATRHSAQKKELLQLLEEKEQEDRKNYEQLYDETMSRLISLEADELNEVVHMEQLRALQRERAARVGSVSPGACTTTSAGKRTQGGGGGGIRDPWYLGTSTTMYNHAYTHIGFTPRSLDGTEITPLSTAPPASGASVASGQPRATNASPKRTPTEKSAGKKTPSTSPKYPLLRTASTGAGTPVTSPRGVTGGSSTSASGGRRKQHTPSSPIPIPSFQEANRTGAVVNKPVTPRNGTMTLAEAVHEEEDINRERLTRLEQESSKELHRFLKEVEEELTILSRFE